MSGLNPTRPTLSLPHTYNSTLTGLFLLHVSFTYLFIFTSIFRFFLSFIPRQMVLLPQGKLPILLLNFVCVCQGDTGRVFLFLTDCWNSTFLMGLHFIRVLRETFCLNKQTNGQQKILHFLLHYSLKK